MNKKYFFSLLLIILSAKSFSQKPDLVITDCGFYYPAGESSLKPGMLLPSVFVVYKNNGKAWSKGDPKPIDFRIQLYLSTTSVSGFGVKTVPVPYNYRDEMELKDSYGYPVVKSIKDALFDNALHTITIRNVKLPDNLGELCKTGSVLLGAVIDPDNLISENDETNNLLCFRSYPVTCKPATIAPPQTNRPSLKPKTRIP